ncbi:MAG TPA: DUF4260 domain-containing protein [Xanthobacteraceae bacterium]|jgi:hypothetical protein
MTVSTATSEMQDNAALRTHAGFVIGGVRAILQLEGLAACAVALTFYAHGGFSWPTFALLFLAPDVSMLGYLAGPRAGAVCYNLAHTYALALAFTLIGFAGGVPTASAGGLIWIAHIGFDRLLGYGLKYPTGFSDTHLSRPRVVVK